MTVNYNHERDDSRETEVKTLFHTLNKTLADMTPQSDPQPTESLIVLVSVVVVEAVSKAALAWGVTPPIRSVADFGGVNEQIRFIHGVKTVGRAGGR